MNNNKKGVTIFGLSGLLLFIFAPILFPIWLIIWMMKSFFKLCFLPFVWAIKGLIKGVKHD